MRGGEPHRGNGGHVHHVAPGFGQRGIGPADEQEERAQVGGELVVPLLRGDLGGGFEHPNPGVVHQHVEAAVGSQGVVDYGVGVVGVAHIAAQPQRELLHRFQGLYVSIRPHHRRPGFGELDRGGPPYAPGRAGDDHHLVGEFGHAPTTSAR